VRIEIYFSRNLVKNSILSLLQIAVKYLSYLGYEAYECSSEDEARSRAEELISMKKWPCFFFESDTTGEKDFEEFYTDNEILDMERFENLGVIKNEPNFDEEKIKYFEDTILSMKKRGKWDRGELVELFNEMIPNFNHKETGKFLDNRM